MQPSFKAPKNRVEFEQRAKDITIEAALSLTKTIQQRRAQAVAPFDAEIAFYNMVVDFKQTGRLPEIKG